MGGTALRIDIEPLGGGTPPGHPRALYDALFTAVRKNIEHLLAVEDDEDPYAAVTAEYLGACHEDGARSTGEKALHFVFSDAAGLCPMSAEASAHMVEVSLAALLGQLDRLAAEHGYRLLRPRPELSEILERAWDTPFVVTKKRLWGLRRREKKPYLFTDEHDEGDMEISPGKVPRRDRERVTAALVTGHCPCRLCEKLRAGEPPLGPFDPEPPESSESLKQALRNPRKTETLSVDGVRDLRGIGALRNLRSLEIGEGELAELPEELGELGKLRDLLISANRLTSLPRSIGNLRSLEWLEISDNPLAALPEELGQLARLDRLHLYGVELRALPSSLGQLGSLTSLDIAGSPLEGLPAELANLKKLRTLSLRRIPALPEWIDAAPIPELKALEHLTLDDCGLARLPRWLPELTALESLSLESNPLESLPEALGQLTALRRLILSGTSVRTLPDSVVALPELEYVSLSRAVVTDADVEALRQRRPGLEISLY